MPAIEKSTFNISNVRKGTKMSSIGKSVYNISDVDVISFGQIVEEKTEDIFDSPPSLPPPSPET